ncbi:hypothetical protein WICMUC_003886 [Wickerhamomyces mucosus]|uniref:CRAL-TRIO domain-containing protein n=1 Tax=Wickerhamomyces mucosus TaxID=1378264 RepID=A0A9P8TB45_9ASCO|nr:hypothetical protein WICMUC_003886 [Wickerhamomyces mucosus]
MEIHTDKVFFKTDTTDPETGLPVYVFDSNYLPNFNNINNENNYRDIDGVEDDDEGENRGFQYDKTTIETILLKAFKKIIPRIPNHPYTLVCFTSGFKNFNKPSQNNNSWIILLKCYQLLPNNLKDMLKRAYIVHESWLIRSFLQILSKINNLNFITKADSNRFNKLIYCKDLSELSSFLNLIKIRISLDVYLYDLQYNPSGNFPQYKDTNSLIDSLEYRNYLNLIKSRIHQRLIQESSSYELVFFKPGNSIKLNILNKAIERGNYLDLSQWDIYVMGTLYLNLLKNFEILIPIDEIEIPIKDDFEYTFKIFNKILNRDPEKKLIKIIPIFINLLNNSHITKHDLKTLSKTITPSLCQLKISLINQDSILIGQRFIKNLLELWSSIEENYLENKSFINQAKKLPNVPPSRKITNGDYNSKDYNKKRNQPKLLPPIPNNDIVDKETKDEEILIPSIRNLSGSSTISTTNSMEEDHKKHYDNSELSSVIIETRPATSLSSPIKTSTFTPLQDLTTTLNKLPKEQLVNRKPSQKLVTKFSDSYSSLQGERKVNKLAQLYEERLKGIQIMNEFK